MPPHVDYNLPKPIERLRYFRSSYTFELEQGGNFPELGLAYHRYGKLNASGTNVIWICHDWQQNSAAGEWWPNMIGPGLTFDTDEYFVICANSLGSCHGTTGPRSLNPLTARNYGLNFPKITVRDQVRAHAVLAKQLGIKKIQYCIGGYDGGYQALEFAVAFPQLIEQLVVLATAAKATTDYLDWHSQQRSTMEQDPTFAKNRDDAGQAGLKNAFGTDLSDRFYAHSVWHLTLAADTHDLSRGRGDLTNVLQGFHQRTLVVGFDNDQLFPSQEQLFLAQHLPNAQLEMVESNFERASFLKEAEKISQLFSAWA